MNTMALSDEGSARTRPVLPSVVKILVNESKAALVMALRMPSYSLPTILFPVMFYLLFGLTLKMPTGPGFDMATYLLASYGACGVVGAALFGLGVGVAVERGQGWLLLKRATPMPPIAYFGGKLVMSVVFGLAVVVLLSLLGVLFGGVEIGLGRWVGLMVTLALGTVPFAAIGMLIGYTVGPNSAPAIVNLVFMPSVFASGLWIPIHILPEFVQKIAYWLPPFHLGQLALKFIEADQGFSTAWHLAVLVGVTAVALGLAVMRYRRDDGQIYG